MTSRIQKYVCDRIPDLARRAERAAVVAVREHRAAPVEDPVHRARDARDEGFHPAGEGVLARSFHDRVHMVVLDRVVHEAEAAAIAGLCETAFEFANQPNVA
jgi:hypothetical protein